jgi:hypothetical protein
MQWRFPDARFTVASREACFLKCNEGFHGRKGSVFFEVKHPGTPLLEKGVFLCPMILLPHHGAAMGEKLLSMLPFVALPHAPPPLQYPYTPKRAF